MNMLFIFEKEKKGSETLRFFPSKTFVSKEMFLRKKTGFHVFC
jgi:hypothetical protein